MEERDAAADELSAIHRVLGGDREAFRLIVERYAPRVIRYLAFRLGSREEAEDAAQEVFLRAWRSLGRFRLGESFPAWLFAIAANRGRSRGARRRAEGDLVLRLAAESALGEPADALSEAERSLEEEALRQALALLQEEHREVLALYYMAGLPVAEVAAALDLGEEAVKSRLFRGRKKLAEILRSGSAQPGAGKKGNLK